MLWKCPHCNVDTHYDSGKHQEVCEKCEWRGEPLTPHKERCFNCGVEYMEFSWFDPSGCNKCFRSFVE
jgi:primosomal protein N'